MTWRAKPATLLHLRHSGYRFIRERKEPVPAPKQRTDLSMRATKYPVPQT